MSALPLQSDSKKLGLGWLVHVVVLVVLCGAVIMFPDYYRMLSTEAVLLAVFAMSLDLIMGYAGIASFGHAAYFGAGGYALGVILLFVTKSLWLALLAAAVVSGLLAFLVGIVSIRARGIYFAIMTLAFGEVLFRIVFHTPALGGSDGLIGIPVPNLNLIFMDVDLRKPLNFSLLAIVFAYLSFLVSRRIVNSPFGRVLMGIRHNEDRIPFLGFDPRRYKIIAFTISGMLAGLSGALFSLFKTFAVTEQLGFLESGKVIVMTLLGGLGTLIGPMIGAAFITFAETTLSAYMESYHIVTGILFILVVLFFRQGLWGLVLTLRKER